MPARRNFGNSVIETSTMNTDPNNCQQLTARPTFPAACPAIPTICSVEIFAATIDIPMSGHVRPRPARKNSELSSLHPFSFPLFHTLSPITIVKNPVNTAMSCGAICMKFELIATKYVHSESRPPWNIE